MDPTPPDAYAGAQLRDGEVSTGTTIMAVSYAGGVVMGADSRVSTGTYIANRVSDKVSALHDKIFMCRSGSAADTQAVSDYVRHYLASHAIEVGAPPLVKTAASLAKRICYTNKEQLLADVNNLLEEMAVLKRESEGRKARRDSSTVSSTPRTGAATSSSSGRSGTTTSSAHAQRCGP